MKFRLLYSVICFLLLSVYSFAGGTELFPLNGAKTLSLNGLYFAGSDGTAKILTNPAAIYFAEGNEVDFGIMDRLTQSKFEGETTGLHRSFRNDDFIINAGLLWSLNENIKIGISYEPALNYNVEWPYAHFYSSGDTATSLLVFDFFNRVKIEAITPSVAFSIGKFAIGISPVAYRIKTETAFPITNPNWVGISSAAYQLENNQDGWAFGFSLGAITDLTPELRAAFSVRSGYSSDLKGMAKSIYFSQIDSTSSSVDIKSKIEIPWIFGLGGVYSFSPDLKLNVDAQYSLWGSVSSSSPQTYNNTDWQNKLSSSDPLSGINSTNMVYNYKNSLDLGVGLEYISENNLSYRFGYRFNQSPNSNSTYNMLFPSVSRHWLSAGFGLTDENIVLEGTITYAIGVSKSVTDKSINNGKYSYEAIIPMVALKYLIR